MARVNRLDLEAALSEHEETEAAIHEILADDGLSDTEKTDVISDLLTDDDDEEDEDEE